MLRHSGPICPANMFPHPIEFWDAKAGCAILPGRRLLRFVDLRHLDNISGTNLVIQGSVFDGENANLVRGENNDVQEDNDARRGREDESNVERNVRPQRESPWDHFFM